MRNKSAIPIAFNMSLGLIPMILCMMLIGVTKPGIVLISGTLTSLTYSLCSYYLSGKKIYNLIAYIGTFVLAIVSFIFILFPGSISIDFIPFTLGTLTLICTGIFFYGQSICKKILNKIKDLQRKDLVNKNIDSNIVSARLIFIMGIINFLLILIALIFSRPLSDKDSFFLFYLLPIVLLSLVIGINQLAIYIASRFTRNEAEIPIVNEYGDVLGKRYKMELLKYKNAYINPVIRIAFIHNGMLFLTPRKKDKIIEIAKIDLPLETYLEFEETLPQGIERAVEQTYADKNAIHPRFSLKHHFKNSETNRLIYLYIVYIEDEELLISPYFINGKLWTFQQIEMNLGKNFFSSEFEAEYDYLKETVKIWEEFK